MEGVRGDGAGHLSPSALISCVSVTSTVSRSVMYPNIAMATYVPVTTTVLTHITTR